MFSFTQIGKSVDIKDLNNCLCTKDHHKVIRHLGIFFCDMLWWLQDVVLSENLTCWTPLSMIMKIYITGYLYNLVERPGQISCRQGVRLV